jgi:acetyl-CoA acetyltransferase
MLVRRASWSFLQLQTDELGIAVGAESLSEGNERLSRPFTEELRAASQEVKDAEVPMGNTSENVARDFGVSRQMQVTHHSRYHSRAIIYQ